MLDQLFKKSPTNSHARSGSNPHLRDSLTNSFYPSGSILRDDVFSDDLPIASTRRGPERGRGQLHHSFDASILTQPVNTHHSGASSARQFARDLPPLLASPIELNTVTKRHNPESITDFQDFAHLPQRSPQRSPQPSPTRLSRLSIPSFAGDHIETVKKEASSKLAGWFNGESSPINIGLLPSPTKEKSDPLEAMPPTAKPPPITSKPGLTSRFSFFTTKSSPARSSIDQDRDDEFLNLDIPTALFPAGPADPFSPSSFKNLSQNAEGLLSRMQAAYKERTVALRDATSEKETIAEELEGAETRSKHLKIQLDDLSARVVEQDKAMMTLVDELANLKRQRVEDEEARKRTIRPVKPSISLPTSGQETTQAESKQGSRRRRSRKDRLSSTSSTDADSDIDSLFSKTQNTSPRMSLSSVSTTSSPETYNNPDLAFTSLPTQPSQPTQVARRQTSAKLVTLPPRQQGQSCVWSCANCQGGGDAAEAWGVVGMLKEENRGLKERVEHVEGALEGCLDVVARLG